MAGKRQAEGPGTYGALRGQALDAVARGLPAPAADHPRVSGVVIDIPADGGFATLMAMTDGTVSLYASVGAGTIGAGGHAAVAAAAHRLLVSIEQRHGSFSADDDTSHPPSDRVRIFVMTPAGRRRADIPIDAFWGRRADPLAPLVDRAQRLITAIRRIPPPEPPRPGG